jgi:MFS family permease
MPELNKVAVDNYKDHPNVKQHVSNLSIGVMNSVLNLGQLLAPIYGALMKA